MRCVKVLRVPCVIGLAIDLIAVRDHRSVARGRGPRPHLPLTPDPRIYWYWRAVQCSAVITLYTMQKQRLSIKRFLSADETNQKFQTKTLKYLRIFVSDKYRVSQKKQ